MDCAELRLPLPGWQEIPLADRVGAMTALRRLVRTRLPGDALAAVRRALLRRLDEAIREITTRGGRRPRLALSLDAGAPPTSLICCEGESVLPGDRMPPELPAAMRRALERAGRGPASPVPTPLGPALRTVRAAPPGRPPSCSAEYWIVARAARRLQLLTFSCPGAEVADDLLARWDAIVGAAAWASDDPSEDDERRTESSWRTSA